MDIDELLCMPIIAFILLIPVAGWVVSLIFLEGCDNKWLSRLSCLAINMCIVGIIICAIHLSKQ
jgi:hypothetical protein